MTPPPRSGVAVWFVDDAPPAASDMSGSVAAHRALDGLLVAYDVAPRPQGRACRLCGGSHGKPGVTGGFEFSVSHSGEHAVVATSFAGPVGVDLERSRRWPGPPAWLDRLDPRERLTVAGPPVASTPALLDCWTRHEAAGKALGCGLAHGLRDLGRALRGDVPGVRVRTVGVAPFRGVSCTLALAGDTVAARTVAPTTVHIGRWTASGPVVDDVREAG